MKILWATNEIPINLVSSSGLPSIGSHGVGHDWSDLAAAAEKVKGFPHCSVSKESACSAGDLGAVPGSEDPLGNEMAPHSSILAWRIRWSEKPGGLQSVGSQVGHDLATTPPPPPPEKIKHCRTTYVDAVIKHFRTTEFLNAQIYIKRNWLK